jgi:hypothetical protein
MIQRIDIQGGQMTFGQRIELGRIITEKELTDIDKMKEGMQCLGVKWNLRNTSEIVEYWYEVLMGIKYWIEREQTELKYEPVPRKRQPALLNSLWWLARWPPSLHWPRTTRKTRMRFWNGNTGRCTTSFSPTCRVTSSGSD